VTQTIAPSEESEPVGADVPDRRSVHFWITLGVITATGLAVRVWGVLVYLKPCHGDPCPPRTFRVWGDALFYHWQGKALSEGHGFIDPIRFYFGGIEEPTAGHPPLYGLYLGAVSLLGSESATAHRLASAVLGCGTVVVLALLARRIAGPTAALFVAAVAALYPAVWVSDYMLMSETMAGFATAVGLYSAYAYWQRPDRLHALLMGAGLGLAALTRAELILLLPFVALPFCLRGLPSWRERFVRLGIVGAAAVVVLGPWVGYNLVRFEKPTYLSTGFGATLSAASCDVTYYGEFTGWYFCGYQADPDLTSVTVVRDGQKGPPVPGDESERDVVVRKYAVDYVEDHLTRLPVVMAARVGRLWYAFRPGQTAYLDGVIEGRGQGAASAVRWTTYVAGALAVYGCVVMWRRRIPILPVLALAATVSIAAALTFGIPRYRIPADVGLALAAGLGLHAGVEQVRARFRGPAGGSARAPAERSEP
jgi:4-amino-4-deoxy-L-arabinose transferase-like glycosyltransferase